MSFVASAWAISCEAVQTPHQRLVLIILADCHNAETGRCDPSIAFLAKRCLISRRSVERCLSQLEGLGLISREKRFEGGVGQTSNAYRLHIESPATEGRTPPSQCRTPPSGRRTAPVTVTQPPRQGDAGPPVRVTHKSGSLNQEENLEVNLERARAPEPVRGSSKFVPDDWEPNPVQTRMVTHDGVDIGEELERFRLHEFAQPKTDWDRAWAAWLRRAAARPAARARDAPGESAVDRRRDELYRNIRDLVGESP